MEATLADLLAVELAVVLVANSVGRLVATLKVEILVVRMVAS